MKESAPVPISSDEKYIAMFCHLAGVLSSFIGPLIIWLLEKDSYGFINQNGKAVINFQLSLLIYYIFILFCITTQIGVVLVVFLPIIVLFVIICPIIAAIKTSKGIGYHYPLAISFLK